MEIKNKSIVQIAYKTYKGEFKSYKGLVFRVREDSILLLVDGQVNDSFVGNTLEVSIWKKDITECKLARLPKEISDKLKIYYQLKEKKLETDAKIEELKKQSQNISQDMTKTANEITKLKMVHSKDMNALITSFRKDVQSAFNIAEESDDYNCDLRVELNNVVNKDKKVYASILFGHSYRHLNDVKHNDYYSINSEETNWKEIAQKYSPDVLSLFQKCFPYVSDITVRKSAGAGDKAWTETSTTYTFVLDINISNYDTIVDQFRKSVSIAINNYQKSTNRYY